MIMCDGKTCGDCKCARYYDYGDYYWCDQWNSQVYTDDEACDDFIEA
jgi:hypothetical protein